MTLFNAMFKTESHANASPLQALYIAI